MEKIDENLITKDQACQLEPGTFWSLDLAPGPETENLTQSLNGMHELLLDGQPVTKGDLDKLSQSLLAIYVDFYGQKMTLQELRENPEFMKNSEFFREILAGNFKNVSSLTLITPLVAEAFVGYEGDLFFGFEDSIPDFLAEALGRRRGGKTYLNLTTLSDKTAGLLASYQGNLYLDRIKDLSDQAAESFASHQGGLHFEFLKNLSPQAVRKLAQAKGNLFLNDLEELSDETAASLAPHEGDFSCGAKNLSDQAIESLSHNKGSLFLRIENLSLPAAVSLSHHQGGMLWLDWLKSLSDEAAKALSFHEDGMSLQWVETISDEAIKALLRHGRIQFGGGNFFDRAMKLKQQQEAEIKTENK